MSAIEPPIEQPSERPSEQPNERPSERPSEQTGEPPITNPRERARARTEAKNQAVRDELEPLAPGERPLAVTIASVAAMLFAIGNFVAYMLTDDFSGSNESRAVVQLVLICVILFAASIGMWFMKYWAVLGFQTVLGLQFIVYSLSMLRAESILAVLVLLALIAASGTLFWFLIRAMARIQLPETPLQKELRERDAESAAHDRPETQEVGE